MEKDNPGIYDDPTNFGEFVADEFASDDEDETKAVNHKRISIDTDAEEESEREDDANKEDDEAEDDDDEEVNESEEDKSDGEEEADDGEGEDDSKVKIEEYEKRIAQLEDSNKKLSSPDETEDGYKREELSKISKAYNENNLAEISKIKDPDEKAKALEDFLTAQNNIDALAGLSARMRSRQENEKLQVQTLFPRHDRGHKDYDPILTESVDELYNMAEGVTKDDKGVAIKDIKTMPLKFYKGVNDLLDKHAELLTVDSQKGEGAKVQTDTPRSKASPNRAKAQKDMSLEERTQRQFAKDFANEIREGSKSYI